MSNPIYSTLMQKNNNNFVGMMAQFNEFKKTFTGDPKQEVMRLLSSGQMSQEQFNQYQSMAQQIQSMMR